MTTFWWIFYAFLVALDLSGIATTILRMYCSDNEDYDVVFETEDDVFDILNVKVSKIRHKIILKESFGD